MAAEKGGGGGGGAPAGGAGRGEAPQIPQPGRSLQPRASSALPSVRSDAGAGRTAIPSEIASQGRRESWPTPPRGLASFRSVSRAGGPRGGEPGWTPGPGGAPARSQLEAGASGKFGDFGNPALAPSLPDSAPAGGWAREGSSAGEEARWRASG